MVLIVVRARHGFVLFGKGQDQEAKQLKNTFPFLLLN